MAAAAPRARRCRAKQQAGRRRPGETYLRQGPGHTPLGTPRAPSCGLLPPVPSQEQVEGPGHDHGPAPPYTEPPRGRHHGHSLPSASLTAAWSHSWPGLTATSTGRQREPWTLLKLRDATTTRAPDGLTHARVLCPCDSHICVS